MTNGADSWPRRALPFGIAVALALVAIARDSWPWIADDAFISLRYAENLLAGHGLCWNPGERVEGYSNLSWVLSSAVLMALGVDPITAVRALALASSAATLLLLAFGRLPPARWAAASCGAAGARGPTRALRRSAGSGAPAARSRC